MAVINRKKLTPLQEARAKTEAAVTAFATLSTDLASASATISAEAETNRAFAADLLAEADSLDAEAAASAKLSTKLAEFLA